MKDFNARDVIDVQAAPLAGLAVLLAHREFPIGRPLKAWHGAFCCERATT